MRKILYLKLVPMHLTDKNAGVKLHVMSRGLLHTRPVDNSLIQNLGDQLIFLKNDYPNFRYWYHNMVIPGLMNRSRQLCVAEDTENRQLAGIMILKNTPEEKKISTLCVLDPYRGCGIGTRFIEIASEQLDTSSPFITVSSNHLHEFEDFFSKLSLQGQVNFSLFNSYEDYYQDGIVEYAFNGLLPRRLKKAANV